MNDYRSVTDLFFSKKGKRKVPKPVIPVLFKPYIITL